MSKNPEKYNPWQPRTVSQFAVDDDPTTARLKDFPESKGRFAEEVMTVMLKKYCSFIDSAESCTPFEDQRKSMDIRVKFKNLEEEFIFQITTDPRDETIDRKRENLQKGVILLLLPESPIRKMWRDKLSDKSITTEDLINRLTQRERNSLLEAFIKATPPDRLKRVIAFNSRD